MNEVKRFVEREFIPGARQNQTRLFFWRSHLSCVTDIGEAEALAIVQAAGYDVASLRYRAPAPGGTTPHFVTNKPVKSPDGKYLDLHCHLS